CSHLFSSSHSGYRPTAVKTLLRFISSEDLDCHGWSSTPSCATTSRSTPLLSFSERHSWLSPAASSWTASGTVSTQQPSPTTTAVICSVSCSSSSPFSPSILFSWPSATRKPPPTPLSTRISPSSSNTTLRPTP